MALFEDLKLLGNELERSTIEKAADIETLVRLNARLTIDVNRKALENQRILVMICEKLGIKLPDEGSGSR